VVKGSPQLDLVVHATHEAGLKLGGIGAVLDGLLSDATYNERVSRTILVGPMTTDNVAEMERLTAPHNQLQIAYSSYHGLYEVDGELGAALRGIEQAYYVRLLYGKRAFGPVHHEIILVDGTYADAARINAYKSDLYHHFGIQSDRYEWHPEYNLHVNMAEPGYRALQAIAESAGGQRVIIAHEFMGLPVCYSAIIHNPDAYRTVFYGHEVATVRPIVELHPGHDTMFYNVLAQARSEGRHLEDIFGDQSSFFKHGLIRPAATHCDNLFAVGDSVVEEMRFLSPAWAQANIDLVYNGVPSYQVSLEEKRASKDRLRQYARNLNGYTPDYVFTHVTRFIPSKGLWRDLRVMEHLDPLLAERGKSAILIVLSTVIPVGRPARAIFEMEASYGWPMTHREATVHVDGQDVPDLVSHEVPFYRAIERFNRTARACRIILVNQFGWSRDRCGNRMPPEMTFADIRQGSDLEFGQSIYEPFGIAQVEPLSFGALCVISSACGCVGFIQRTGGLDQDNVIMADYVGGAAQAGDIETALAIDQAQRDQIETQQAHVVALEIADRLPEDDAETKRLLETGYAASQKMSWQVVVREYLLPGLARTLAR
jgi:hypothetical protein